MIGTPFSKKKKGLNDVNKKWNIIFVTYIKYTYRRLFLEWVVLAIFYGMSFFTINFFFWFVLATPALKFLDTISDSS